MGIAEAPDIYSYIVINVWRKKNDQPQRAMSGMYFVRKICVNRCKSVSKNRPEDTDSQISRITVLSQILDSPD